MKYLEIFILIYVTIVFFVYILMANRANRKHKPIIEKNDEKPTITVIIPAYNEELVIISSINSLLKQDYENFDIIVINDGSTDNTLKVLNDNFKNNDKITILTKENSGKASTLNVGILHATGEWTLFMDADTIFEPNAISRLVATLDDDSDATSCMISTLNGCVIEDGQLKEPLIPSKILPRIQWMEYLRTFVMWRASTIDKNATIVISGACGMVKRVALLEIGGFKDKFIGEDMELTLNLHKHDKKIQFVPEVLAWTEVPETLKGLRKQRVRWFRGGLQSLLEHRSIMKKKNNKFLSRFLLPFIWFADVLGPWVELAGFIMTLIGLNSGTIDIVSFIFIWLYAASLHTFSSLLVLRFARKRLPKLVNNKNFLKVWPVFILEPFTYHFFHITWMLNAHINQYLGVKPKWNKINRKGINKINK